MTWAASATNASAYPWTTLWKIANQTRQGSQAGDYTPQEESKFINDAWEEYRKEQKALGTPIVGQAVVSGKYPTLFLPPGAQAQLQFVFIDPGTGLATQGTPVGSVQYFVNLDPNQPDNLQFVGMSANPQTGFAVPVNVAGFEPSYLAVPFDPAGNPIVIPGVDGDNDAVGLATVLFAGPHHTLVPKHTVVPKRDLP
jgi:hypothetical protein